MSYKIKNGKLAKFIRETRPQVGEADMLASVGNGGGVFHMMMAHDDWCLTMKTGNGSDCNCNPDVTYYREPRPKKREASS